MPTAGQPRVPCQPRSLRAGRLWRELVPLVDELLSVLVPKLLLSVLLLEAAAPVFEPAVPVPRGALPLDEPSVAAGVGVVVPAVLLLPRELPLAEVPELLLRSDVPDAVAGAADMPGAAAVALLSPGVAVALALMAPLLSVAVAVPVALGVPLAVSLAVLGVPLEVVASAALLVLPAVLLVVLPVPTALAVSVLPEVLPAWLVAVVALVSLEPEALASVLASRCAQPMPAAAAVTAATKAKRRVSLLIGNSSVAVKGGSSCADASLPEKILGLAGSRQPMEQCICPSLAAACRRLRLRARFPALLRFLQKHSHDAMTQAL